MIGEFEVFEVLVIVWLDFSLKFVGCGSLRNFLKSKYV